MTKKHEANKKLEKCLLDKYIQENQFDQTYFFQRIEFKERFIGIDPIMDLNVSFDGYYKDNNIEQFIEVKISSSIMDYYRIYYQLNKVYLYRKTANPYAQVVLLLPAIEDDIENLNKTRQSAVERLKNVFMPAITSGLLVIKNIKVTNEDMK